jgi:hypothetical protein
VALGGNRPLCASRWTGTDWQQTCLSQCVRAVVGAGPSRTLAVRAAAAPGGACYGVLHA